MVQHTETLEAKIKLLEDQLEERNNDELDLQQRLSATLQEIEYFQTKASKIVLRAVNFCKTSYLTEYVSLYMDTLGEITLQTLPYNDVSEYFSDQDPARGALMNSILANGTLIMGNTEESKDFYRESIHQLDAMDTREHPDLMAKAYVNLANYAMSCGTVEELDKFLNKVIQIGEQESSRMDKVIQSQEMLLQDAYETDVDAQLYHTVAIAHDWKIMHAPSSEFFKCIAAGKKYKQLTPTTFMYLRLVLRELGRYTHYCMKSGQILELKSFFDSIDSHLDDINSLPPKQRDFLLLIFHITRMHAYLAAHQTGMMWSEVESLIKVASRYYGVVKGFYHSMLITFAALPLLHYLQAQQQLNELIETFDPQSPVTQLCMEQFKLMIAHKPMLPFHAKCVGAVAEYLTFGEPAVNFGVSVAVDPALLRRTASKKQ